MEEPQINPTEKIAMITSIASIFIALLMFELITPTYRTVTSLLFNNGIVIIFLIIGTYWAFGRDVKAFTEHQGRIYVFSRIIAPGVGLVFFVENLATYAGFGSFFGNLAGIAACLLTIIFGAFAEISDHPNSEETPQAEDIATQELRIIMATEQQKKLVSKEEEPNPECRTLVH